MAKRVQEISSCKIFVIACHTISVWCIKDIEQALGVPVIGMVEPSLRGLELLISGSKHIQWAFCQLNRLSILGYIEMLGQPLIEKIA